MGWWGCNDNLAREALMAPQPAQEEWAEVPRSPIWSISGNDKGGISRVLRSQLWHSDLREGSVSGTMDPRAPGVSGQCLFLLHPWAGWHLWAVGAGRVSSSFLEKVPLLLGERCEEDSVDGVPAGVRCDV